jgi:hypothetical protein
MALGSSAADHAKAVTSVEKMFFRKLNKTLLDDLVPWERERPFGVFVILPESLPGLQEA